MNERNSTIYYLDDDEEFTLPICIEMQGCTIQNVPVENFRMEICRKTNQVRIKMIGLEIRVAKS